MVAYLFITLKALAAWGIMIFVGMNLIGFMMTGLCFKSPPLEMLVEPDDSERIKDLIAHELKKASRNSRLMAIFFSILVIAYYYLIYHFWNGFLLCAAIILMAIRLPDLLWEIRTRLHITKEIGPQGGIYTFTSISYYLVFPLVWYAFYYVHH